MKATLHPILLASTLCLLALPARADLAPPETEPCQGKSIGTACTFNNASGSCQKQTCYHLDYSSWDRDASAAPPMAAYDCVECTTGTSTNTSTSTTTTTDSDGGAPPSNGDGGCTIAKPSMAKRIAPWLLAATFSTLFLVGRRRRRD